MMDVLTKQIEAKMRGCKSLMESSLMESIKKVANYRLEAYEEVLKEIKQIQQKQIVTMKEIENAVGDTSDEYTEGVVELFESKGFEIGR